MSVRASVFASNLAMRQTGGKRRTFGGWLHTISYGVWLGGLISIGAFVAPNVAHVLHNYPMFANDKAAQNEILTAIIGNSLRFFNIACYICGGCMILSDLLQASSAEPQYRQFTFARTFFTVILIASTLYLAYVLLPAMDHYRLLGAMPKFDVLHKRYELVSKLQLVPLLIIPALTARRDRALDTGY